MPVLQRVGAFGRRTVEVVDDYARRAGRDITQKTSSGVVKTAGIVGGTIGGVRAIGAYETKKSSEATQAYAEAYQAIMNDPNLSPEEKQRRIEALREDFNSGPGEAPASGPGAWFNDMSYKQIAMWAAVLYVGAKALPPLIRGVM